MLRTLKDVVSTIAAIVAIMVGVLSLTDRLPSSLDVGQKPVLILMAVLFGLTIYLQWHRIYTKIVSAFQAFVGKAAPAAPALLAVSLILSVFILIAAGAITWEFQQFIELEELHATKFVGVFPDNIPAITRLVGSAESELLAAVDFPSYGSFSAPKENRLYLRALVDALQRKVKVRIVLYAPEKAEQATEDQFEYESWVAFKKEERFKRFLSFQPGWKRTDSTIEGDFPTVDEWHQYLEALDQSAIRELITAGAKVDQTTELPAYLWLADGHEAIFSFYNLREEPSEVSFGTKDRRLIEVLRKLYQRAADKTVVDYAMVSRLDRSVSPRRQGD